MRKKKWIIIIVLLLVLAGICTIYFVKQAKAKKEEDDGYLYVEHFDIETRVDDIEWIGVAEDGVSTCLVEYGRIPGYNIVPGRSIIFLSLKGTQKRLAWTVDKTFEYDQFKIYVYDIETGESRLLFDMVEFLKQYPDMQIAHMLGDGRGCVLLDGESVYQRLFEPKPQIEIPYSEVDRDFLCINIEDGSYSIQEKRQPDWESNTNDIFYNWKGYSLFEQNLPQELTEEMNIFVYRNYEGVFAAYAPTEYLPEHNEVLYGMFPELEQYRGEKDCYIYMLIGGDPSAEELLRLFMEDGQEISFEGAVLSGEQSIDGEDHEIHSFEEYEQWRDYDK